MAQFTHSWKVDLQKSIKVEQLQTVLSSQDSDGHRIQVEVYNNGEPHSLTGEITGTVQRADGSTVVVSGNAVDNKAYIILPAAAYAVVGRIVITIKNYISGSSKTTLLMVGATVRASTTGEWIDPGDLIPDAAELLAQANRLNSAISKAESLSTVSLRYVSTTDIQTRDCNELPVNTAIWFNRTEWTNAPEHSSPYENYINVFTFGSGTAVRTQISIEPRNGYIFVRRMYANAYTKWVDATDKISVDTTLAQGGAAADAKATGDAIDELKQVALDSVNGAEVTSGLLSDFAPNSYSWVNRDKFTDGPSYDGDFDSYSFVITLGNYTNSDAIKSQLLIDATHGHIFTRRINNKAISDWVEASFHQDLDTTLSVEGKGADASAVGVAVNSTREISGINLFNRESIIKGKNLSASGVISDAPSYFISQQIPVESINNNYYLWVDTTPTTYIRVFWFDSTDTFIVRDVFAFTNGHLGIMNPSNRAAYVVIAAAIADCDIGIVFSATQPSEYVPYYSAIDTVARSGIAKTNQNIDNVLTGQIVRYDVAQALTSEQKALAQANIGISDSIDSSLKNAVLYEQQTKTDLEKKIARENIGVVPDSSLSVSGGFAESAATGRKIAANESNINTIKQTAIFPKNSSPKPGDVIKADANGLPMWAANDVVSPDDIAASVNQYIIEHPEALVAIEDGSITESKFADTVVTDYRNEYVNVLSRGVIADGSIETTFDSNNICTSVRVDSNSTDNAIIINSIIANCVKNNETVFFPSGTYYVSNLDLEYIKQGTHDFLYPNDLKTKTLHIVGEDKNTTTIIIGSECKIGCNVTLENITFVFVDTATGGFYANVHDLVLAGRDGYNLNFRMKNCRATTPTNTAIIRIYARNIGGMSGLYLYDNEFFGDNNTCILFEFEHTYDGTAYTAHWRPWFTVARIVSNQTCHDYIRTYRSAYGSACMPSYFLRQIVNSEYDNLDSDTLENLTYRSIVFSDIILHDNVFQWHGSQTAYFIEFDRGTIRSADKVYDNADDKGNTAPVYHLTSSKAVIFDETSTSGGTLAQRFKFENDASIPECVAFSKAGGGFNTQYARALGSPVAVQSIPNEQGHDINFSHIGSRINGVATMYPVIVKAGDNPTYMSNGTKVTVDFVGIHVQSNVTRGIFEIGNLANNTLVYRMYFPAGVTYDNDTSAHWSDWFVIASSRATNTVSTIDALKDIRVKTNGICYYVNNIHKPVWYYSGKWYDAAGAEIS